MPRHQHRIQRRSDAALAATYLALVGAVSVSSLVHQVDAVRPLLFLSALGAVYLTARVLDNLSVLLVLAGLVGVTLSILLLSPELREGAAGGAPLHYGNANGALLAMGVCAALAFAARVRGLAAIASVAAAVVLVAGCALSGSLAATLLAAGALLGAALVAASGGRGALTIAVACAVTTTAFLALTLVLGATYDPTAPGPEWALRALSEARLALWHEGLGILRAQPLLGAGADRFPQLSATAQDPDLAYAHSYLLELGAEYGVVALAAGAVLPAALIGVMASRRRGGSLAVGALTVLVFFGQAAEDYTYRFPAVALPAALLIGLATSTSPIRSSRVP